MSEADPVKFSFTKIVVSDLEHMADFYAELQQRKPVQRVQAAIDGAPIDEIIFDGGNGVGLVLLKWVSQAAPDATGVIVGFATPDIAAFFARAEAAGAKVRQSPRPIAEAGGRNVGFLEDPEGHLLEVVEMPA
jgi:predicted enzyme related to lactoylglutathione lyase